MNISEPGYNISYIVKFIPVDGGQNLETEATYNNAARTIYFQIPSGLQTSTIYAAQLVRKRTRIRTIGQQIQGTLNQSNFNQTIQNIRYQTLAANVQVRKVRIDGRIIRHPNEHLYYVLFFKTSQFRNLQSKVSAMNVALVQRQALGVLESFKVYYNIPERFDVFDVNGYSYNRGIAQVKVPPLVKTSDGLSSTWFSTFLNPVIYQYYNTLKNYTTRRLRSPRPDYGIPPVNTVENKYPQNPLSEIEYLLQSQSPSNQHSNFLTSLGSGYLGGVGGGIGFGSTGFSGGLISWVIRFSWK